MARVVPRAVPRVPRAALRVAENVLRRVAQLEANQTQANQMTPCDNGNRIATPEGSAENSFEADHLDAVRLVHIQQELSELQGRFDNHMQQFKDLQKDLVKQEAQMKDTSEKFTEPRMLNIQLLDDKVLLAVAELHRRIDILTRDLQEHISVKEWEDKKSSARMDYLEQVLSTKSLVAQLPKQNDDLTQRVEWCEKQLRNRPQELNIKPDLIQLWITRDTHLNCAFFCNMATMGLLQCLQVFETRMKVTAYNETGTFPSESPLNRFGRREIDWELAILFGSGAPYEIRITDVMQNVPLAILGGVSGSMVKICQTELSDSRTGSSDLVSL